MKHVLWLCLLLTPLLGDSNQASKNNGYWWADLSPSFKLGYVSGYTRAMSSAGISELVRCTYSMNQLKDRYSPELRTQFCLDGLKSFDFDNITMGQFVSGADDFYQDYKNKNLEIAFALEYVRDDLHGKVRSELDSELIQWRAATADP